MFYFLLCSVGKVDHQLTVISRIQSRFRRDKSVKNEMTSHDEAIHHYERLAWYYNVQ